MQVKNERIYSDSKTAGLSSVNSQKDVEGSDTQNQSDIFSMMSYLKEKYGNINFEFSSFENRQKIGQYGATQKGTNNVAISPELLEKMSSDESIRSSVENILDHMSSYQKSAQIEAMLFDKELTGMGLVIDEDGKVLQWTATKKRDKESVYPSYWRDRESTSFYSKHVKKKSSLSTYNYSHTSNMMRLASARNVPAVKGLISAKYGEIQKVKMQGMEPSEASAIIRKIKSVILNGNLKIARLHKEENLELRKKSAEKKMKEKLALELARELSRKRRSRMGLEQCQTADLDDVMPGSSAGNEYFQQMVDQYLESLSSTISSDADISSISIAASDAASVSVMDASLTVIDCSA